MCLFYVWPLLCCRLQAQTVVAINKLLGVRLSSTMSKPIVEVAEGKLQGLLVNNINNKQYYAFKGVPFAKPPIGKLRFASPLPPESWAGVRDATQDSKFCIQFDQETSTLEGEEDCLYLNVYTPKLPGNGSEALPVMVFYHGGGFVFGCGTDETSHGPDFLLEKDVVIVIPNYRLGVLGFLSLERKEAAGNMGLKDQVQALKWVKQNIAKFNGDSNNVTVFGASAGAVSVEYLLLSPMARGLFHKCIAQAGSTLNPWARNDSVKQLAYKLPLALDKSITDDEKLYKYLMDLPVNDLVQASMKVIFSEKHRGGIWFGFVPTVEKAGDWETFLEEQPYVLLKRGDFAKVPYVSGYCREEGLLMTTFKPTDVDNLAKQKNFMNYLPFKVDDSKQEDVEDKIKDIYQFKNGQLRDDFAVNFFTDVDFLGGINVSVNAIAEANSPVYFYEFCYDGGLNLLKKKRNITRPGACHGDDGGYIFSVKVLHQENVTDTDKLVRERMTTMWTNFAKFGDPTPTTDEVITSKWEAIVPGKGGLRYLQIDHTLKMKGDLPPQRVKLFENLYAEYQQD